MADTSDNVAGPGPKNQRRGPDGDRPGQKPAETPDASSEKPADTTSRSGHFVAGESAGSTSGDLPF